MVLFTIARRTTLGRIALSLMLLLGVQVHAASSCEGSLKGGIVAVQGEAKTERFPGFYRFVDKTYGFQFEAALSSEGELLIEAYLVSSDKKLRSQKSGRRLYMEMIEHIGLKNIRSIKGIWFSRTNFDQFVASLLEGHTQSEAALSTWSGQMANSVGFSQVASVDMHTYESHPEILEYIEATFVRPRLSQD